MSDFADLSPPLRFQSKPAFSSLGVSNNWSCKLRAPCYANFSSWGRSLSPCCLAQLGRAHSLREICGGPVKGPAVKENCISLELAISQALQTQLCQYASWQLYCRKVFYSRMNCPQEKMFIHRIRC